MSISTDVHQMEEDLKHRSEKLEVEFKAWMDISKNNKDGQAKIARHIAAISNSGGGRLYFGVDDNGSALQASADFGLEHYRSDAIHNLLKARLEPPLQCDVRFTEYTNGVTYPVLYIPSHGSVPIGARDENSYFQIYVRGVGPESIKASTFQHWDTLLKRCMRFRDNEIVQTGQEDDLSRTQAMTKSITDSVTSAVLKTLADSGVGSTKPTPDGWTTIRLYAETTRQEFVDGVSKIPLGDAASDQQIREIAKNHVTMGYALLDSTHGFITLEKPHKLLRAASDCMKQLAYFGWNDFIVLPNSDGPPRSRLWNIDGRDVPGVEGIRLDALRVYFGTLDYWRVYGNSIFVICKSYQEDYNRLRHHAVGPFLTSTQIFIRVHSLLSHAATVATIVKDAARIAIFTDHRGLMDRNLGTTFDYGLRVHTHLKAGEDRFPTGIVVTRDELIRDYFGTLKRVCLPFLELWAGAGFDPDEWFTPENIGQVVTSLNNGGSAVHLFEPQFVTQ